MYTLLLTAALMTDATLVQTIKVEMNPNVPVPSGPAGDALKNFAEPQDVFVISNGQQMLATMGKLEIVYALDSGQMRLMDRANQRYAQAHAADWEALARAMGTSKAATGDTSWIKTNFRHVGEGAEDKSAGLACRNQRYEMTFEAASPAPDARTEKVTTAQRFELEYCLAQAPAELSSYLVGLNRLMELMASFSKTGASSSDSMMKPVTQFQEELTAKKQMAVKMTMRIFLNVRSLLPDGAEIPPQLASLVTTPITTFIVDTKSYTAGKADPAKFAVPEGFRQVPIESLDAASLITSR